MHPAEIRNRAAKIATFCAVIDELAKAADRSAADVVVTSRAPAAEPAPASRRSTFLATLRARWIAKRNEFIRDGQRIRDGVRHTFTDDYARRELRAYRLAQVWARDESLPGEWWWCRRDQRWDVYPQRERPVLMRVVRDGPWHTFFHPDGTKACVSYYLGHRAAPIRKSEAA